MLSSFIDKIAYKQRQANRKFSIFVVSVVSALFFVALLGYDAHDPSFNVATSGTISNPLGKPGAFIADIFVQFFGSACFVFPIGTCLYHFRSMRYIPILGMYIGMHWISTLLFALCMAHLCHKFGISIHAKYGFGGTSGRFMSEHLSSKIVYLLIVVSVIMFIGIYRIGMLCIKFGDLLIASTMLSYFKISDKFRKVEYVQEETPNTDNYSEESEERMPIRPASFTQNTVNKKRSVQQVKSVTASMLPPIELLFSTPADRVATFDDIKAEETKRALEQVLSEFGVNGTITDIKFGPVVTLYELTPSAGVKSSRVIGLADDVARSMSTTSVRISVIAGKNAIGIEIPNQNREIVTLREIIESKEYSNSLTILPIALGKVISGEPIVVDLAKMPHLLIAGTTGSGKSVAINTMILSLLYRLSPKQCKMIMIDPKMLELSIYDGIPHLLIPVVTDPKKAVSALKWAVREMEQRYRMMSDLGVRNIAGYNEKMENATNTGEILKRKLQTGFNQDSGEAIIEEVNVDMAPMPYIVIIVDEMADLMIVAGKDIETLVQRLAQMARAAGIHIIMATQRPSVDVITGVIKANFPTRISFAVTSKIDSRTILGEQGAEQLLGMGDMLYMASGGRIFRIHGPFVSDNEVQAVVTSLKRTGGNPQYVDNILTQLEDNNESIPPSGDSSDDENYRHALSIVTSEGKVSTSYIQRQLRIGYNRAANIVERMEREGYVSAPNHSGKREVIKRE